MGNGYLYVGETCERFGAMGRWARHLSYKNEQNKNGATFLNNLKKYTSCDDLNLVRNIYFIAVELEEYGVFDGDANKTKRMGLEYLVRSEMQTFSSDDSVKIPYELISTAKKTRYSDKVECERLAIDIVKKISEQIIFVTGVNPTIS